MTWKTRMFRTFQRKGFRAVFLVLLINLAFITVRHFFRRLPEAAPLRAIGYACDEGYCGGWADRQKGIVNAFVIAAILGQKFKVHMPQPCELGFFLSPGGAVDWRLEPGELIGRDVNRMIILNSPKALAFAEEFLSLENPLDMLEGEYVFLTSNVEMVQHLRKHKLAQKIPWLQELSIPEIYRLVLTELFTLMPGPRAVLESFQHSLPSGTQLVCSQIRVGGQGDTESFNTLDQFQALASFLAPFNSSSRYRFMFTSDSPAMVRHARSYFPSRTVAMEGPVTHVDRSIGSDVCAGFVHAILEQLMLSTCHVLVISESGLSKIAAFLRNTDRDLYIFHDGVVDKFKRENPFPNRSW